MKIHPQTGKMGLVTAFYIYRALKDCPVAAYQVGNTWHYDPSKDHAQRLFAIAAERLRKSKLAWWWANR